MTKIIAVHSYKGGTGKTSMSVNLAASFAKAGKKV
jgi:cellulose biosynthesis protein BcsQ